MSGLQLGLELRDRGIARATADPGVSRLIRQIRNWAEARALSHGSVSINEVREHFDLTGVPPNALGAIFRDRRFTPAGFTRADHPDAHARIVRTYVLTKEPS